MDRDRYSVLISGKREGFLHSTRGLNQGDPLSPAFLIFGAEDFSRMLNRLVSQEQFRVFSIYRRGPQITYLAYSDDVIICSFRNETFLRLIQQLKNYEACSKQLVNAGKSCFLVAIKTEQNKIQAIKEITDFRHTTIRITYLGYPLYVGIEEKNFLL